MPLAPEIDLQAVAMEAEGLSGAETSLICREAGLKALSIDNQIERLDSQAEEFKISKEIVHKALEEVKQRGGKKQTGGKGVLF